MSQCVTCLAADSASDASLRTLVRYQAIKLEQARAALLPVHVENGRLRDRIRELEEIVEKQNRRLASRRAAS